VEAWRWAQDYQWEASYGAGPDPSVETPESADSESLYGITGQTIRISLQRMAEWTLNEILRAVYEKTEHGRDISHETNQSATDATLNNEGPQIGESNATTPDMSYKSVSVLGKASELPLNVHLITKKRSVNDTSEENGFSMHSTAEEYGAPRSVKKANLDAEQPKNTRPVQSSGGGSPHKRAQRLRLNPPEKPGSSHDPSVAVISGVEYVQNSGDNTRNKSYKAEGPTRNPRLRLTFKAG